jgi:hypothetical protein
VDDVGSYSSIGRLGNRAVLSEVISFSLGYLALPPAPIRFFTFKTKSAYIRNYGKAGPLQSFDHPKIHSAFAIVLPGEILKRRKPNNARVAEQVDARDLKSLGT